MASMPSPEWARRLGASPPKRLAASWSGSRVDPTEDKIAVRGSHLMAGSPRIVSAKTFSRGKALEQERET